MKAAIYLGKEHIEIQDLPTPVCGPEDVLLETIYSSICGTDVAVYTHGPNTGHKITAGGEFGHETVCRVAAVGEQVTDIRPGQRVYPYPLYVKNDAKRAGTIGGFSQYILAPKAKLGHSLYPVPEAIPDRLACLIEPFTVGCRAARRSQPRKGDKAVVFGCGTIGLAAAVALQFFGVEQVMVCDKSAFRLNIARKLGFLTCHMEQEDFTAKTREVFGAAHNHRGPAPDVDIFLDAAGAASILQLFLDQGKIESRFVSVAVSKGLREIDLLDLTYAQKSIIGSGGYTPEDVADVMTILASGRWDLEAIITHTFPLEELATAIETAADVEHALNVTIRF